MEQDLTHDSAQGDTAPGDAVNRKNSNTIQRLSSASSLDSGYGARRESTEIRPDFNPDAVNRKNSHTSQRLSSASSQDSGYGIRPESTEIYPDFYPGDDKQDCWESPTLSTNTMLNSTSVSLSKIGSACNLQCVPEDGMQTDVDSVDKHCRTALDQTCEDGKGELRRDACHAESEKVAKSGNVGVSPSNGVMKVELGVKPDQHMKGEIEEALKDRELDVNAAADVTPLHTAVINGNYDFTKKLIENGADINSKDKYGLTPLMLAASKGNTRIVSLLGEKGVNFKDVNNSGKTARQIAKENGHLDTENYIFRYEFMLGPFTAMKQALSKLKLDEIKSQGGDVKRHLVNSLKEHDKYIKQMLADMGFDSFPNSNRKNEEVTRENRQDNNPTLLATGLDVPNTALSDVFVGKTDWGQL